MLHRFLGVIRFVVLLILNKDIKKTGDFRRPFLVAGTGFEPVTSGL